MADVTVKQGSEGRTILEIAYTAGEQTKTGAPASEKLDVPFMDDAEVDALVKERVSEYMAAKAVVKPASKVIPVDTSKVAAKPKLDVAVALLEG